MSNSNHHDGCGCWMCDEDRIARGEESIHVRHDREANQRVVAERAARGLKCICTDPYAAFHSAACMKRNGAIQ